MVSFMQKITGRCYSLTLHSLNLKSTCKKVVVNFWDGDYKKNII